MHDPWLIPKPSWFDPLLRTGWQTPWGRWLILAEGSGEKRWKWFFSVFMVAVGFQLLGIAFVLLLKSMSLNPPKALTPWLLESIAGHPQWGYTLARTCHQQAKTSFEWQQCKVWLDKNSLNQHHKTFALLAEYYEMGYAGEASASKALGYYRLAAEGGEATAALRLGQAFLMGQMGASRHPSMALHWFETAQKLGNPEAALNVGSLYYYRLVMPHATNTLGKAVQAWSDAAKGGSIDAVKHLTHYFDPHTPSRVIHPRGLDIQAENPHEALKWYQVGALYHDLEAMWHLHLKLKQHQPSATSRLQAQAWLNAAAWEGLGKAQYTLAHQAMTQHNLKEAYVWASLAVAHGERQGYSLKQTLEQTLKQNPAQWQQVLESYRQRFTTIYQRIQSIKALQEETKSS